MQRYTDHVNDYRSGLVGVDCRSFSNCDLTHHLQGLAVDPSQTHVFAAGSDQVIRAWSIWDGTPVPYLERQSKTPSQRRLLGEQHSALVNGIEISEEDKIHILNDRQLETYMQY